MGKKVKISDLIYDKTPRIVGIPGADIKAKVSADDTTAGYLNGKLVEGTNVDFTENNPGLNETLTIAVSNPVVANVTGNCSGSSGSCTGNASTVTTNANLTGPITSVGNATSIASQTGTGTKFVVDTSPTIVTPTVASFLNANHTHAAAGATGGLVEHHSLNGLGDDDHTIYTKKATLTEQGDLYYASAASTPAALVHGITGQILISGGHGANPSWTGAIDLTDDSSIAAGKKILLEGAGSDSYLIYNSTTKKVELYVDGVLVNSWGNNGLKMLMDGTTSTKDLITPPSTAFTMTGGVAGSFADATNGNFQLPISTGLLGAQAPVIAQAVDNILSDEAASFEAGTLTGWDTYAGSVTSDSSWAIHGSKNMKLAHTGATGARYLSAPVSDGVQYTISAIVKVVSGSAYFRYYDSGGWQDGTTTVTAGNTGTIKNTFTPVVGKTNKQFWIYSSAACEIYIDVVQLETGAVQTPFALDTRTACKMTIPTATIGLVAGQSASVMIVHNGPWAGNDGVGHYLFDAKGAGAGDVFSLYKHTDNKLYFEVGNKSAVTAALTAVTWAANTNHIIIGTVTAAGTIDVYLGGAAGTQATGATREAALNANVYIGTKIDGTLQAKGGIIGAAEITAISAWTLWTSATTCGPAIGSTYFDDVNDRFYVYTSNGWRYAALT
jgi:hypothetical protein